MNNFDLGSKKYMIILMALCLILVLLVVKAFDMAPSSDKENYTPAANAPVANTVPETANSVNTNSSVQTDEPVAQEEQTSTIEQTQNANAEPTEGITPIDGASENAAAVEDGERKLAQDEELELQFYNIEKYVKNSQFDRALAEYNAILKDAPNVDITARCYEEMAKIYGVTKRYGTAISYAQKAYNMSPTSSREMLIARLYYKTGDKQSAEERISNILEREFIAEDE